MTESQVVIDQQATELIEEDIRHLFDVMGFTDIRIRCALKEENTLMVNIDAGNDGRLLIGVKGSHLEAVQHIVRCVLRRRLNNEYRTIVDVNQYRNRREQSLVRLAEQAARKAQQTGRTIVMDAMSASDRRTVHTALAGNKNVHSESLGEDPNRRVVVKPVFL